MVCGVSGKLGGHFIKLHEVKGEAALVGVTAAPIVVGELEVEAFAAKLSTMEFLIQIQSFSQEFLKLFL